MSDKPSVSLESTLLTLERFFSKEWRVFAKDDPLAKLSFNEFDYLKVLQAHAEPMRITELAKEMIVSKPSASNMVVRLEKKGLVQRVNCAEDGRVKQVILTDKAQEDLALEEKVNALIAAKLESKVSPQEVQQFVTILQRMLG